MQPTEGPWLNGFAARGVGGLQAEEPVRVGPLRRMNFLVGRNNHGKSTLMRMARYWGTNRPNSQAGLALESLARLERQQLLQVFSSCNQDGVQAIARGLAEGRFVGLEGDAIGVWVSAKENPQQHDQQAWVDALALGGYRPRDMDSREVRQTLGQVIMVPAFRQMRPAVQPDQPDIESGEGLVRLLQYWERPPNPGSQESTASIQKWARLNAFLQDVLEDDGTALEVAANGTDLHVRLSQHGDMLDIKDLGDGIKQVLMLAAVCVLYDDNLICIEEPEIHLHAGLQRKLMRFLNEKTENQYLIATHSAHILDTPDAGVFHVVHDGKSTRVVASMNSSDVQAICQDLGYLASDLLQANYTVWVEGPSDRIYWRRWLRLVDPDLEEGVHFSMMSYGGRLIDDVELLSDDSDTGDALLEPNLVRLVRLGRSCTVIADSDKASDKEALHPTVVRLISETSTNPNADVLVCAWVRTVENLIPRELLRDTVIGIHPISGKRLAVQIGPFDKPFAGMRAGSYSKTTIARSLAPAVTLDHVDQRLQDATSQLAERIRRANGLSVSAVAT